MAAHRSSTTVKWLGGIVAGPLLLVANTTWMGRAFLVASLLLGIAGFRSQSNAVILAACILAAALLAAGLASYLSIVGLRFSGWFTEEEPFVGERTTLCIKAVNHNVLPAGFLFFIMRPGGRLRPPEVIKTVPYVAPRRRAAVEFPFRAATRGRLRVAELRVRSVFPTGLFRTSMLKELECELLVLPRVGQLGGRFRSLLAEGVESRVYSPAFLSGETRSLREYHPGDNLRRVHWRMSAHRGELVVREFEEPLGMEVLLLLDAFCPPNRREDFEWTVSLAATLALRGTDSNLRVRIILGGPKPEVLYCEDRFGVHEALRRLATFRGRVRSFAPELIEFTGPLPTEGVVLLAGVAPDMSTGPRAVVISPEKDRDLLVFAEAVHD